MQCNFGEIESTSFYGMSKRLESDEEMKQRLYDEERLEKLFNEAINELDIKKRFIAKIQELKSRKYSK